MAAVFPFRTAEARWFQEGEIPADVRAWFDALGPAVEAEERTDYYLAPTDDALGVKVREGRIETKRRDGAPGRLQAGRAEAAIGVWAKWSFSAEGDPEPTGAWVAVEKTRWQREVETAGASCSLELGEVTVEGDVWWTVALEASGGDEAARRLALVEAARQWLGRDDAPVLPASAAMGYPAWLRILGDERA